MEKSDQLEQLKNLKDNGVITEEEFENEKQRILNYEEHPKVQLNKSKLYFIIATIFAIITVILIILFPKYKEEYEEYPYIEKMTEAEFDYKYGEISKYEYEKIRKQVGKEYDKVSSKSKAVYIGIYVVGSFMIISLTSGIIIYKKENKKE